MPPQVELSLVDQERKFQLCVSQEHHAGWGDGWLNNLVDYKPARTSALGLTCAVNDVNAIILYERFGALISYRDELVKLTFAKLVGQSALRARVAKVHAAWNESQAVPKGTLAVTDDPELALSPYQVVPALASMMIPGYLVGMEQGTGKTPVAIARACTAAAQLRATGATRPYKVLVVCPKQVQSQWVSEFTRFSGVPVKASVLRGSDPARRVRTVTEALANQDGEMLCVVVVSYGLIMECWHQVLQWCGWDLAVADESHMIASPEAKRTKLMHEVRDKSKARMALTGTPIKNGPMDLWAQLEFCETGLSGHLSFAGYKREFGVWEKSWDGKRDVMVATGNIPGLKRRLAECSFFVRKDEVLKDLPKKQYDILEVEMSKKQQEDYKSVSTQLYLEIEELFEAAGESDQKRAMAVQNAFTKLVKLSQITSGFLILNEELDETGEVLHEAGWIIYDEQPKLDLLEQELLLLPPDEKAIVWSCHRIELDMIVQRLRKMGIGHAVFQGSTSERDRELAKYNFNNTRECQVLVANAGAGGTGLNMVGYNPDNDLGTNCAQHFYVSQSTKPVERWQSEDRSHRRTTRVSVRYRDIVVPGTIDEDIRVRVVEKKKAALDLQDLRAMLSNIARGKR